MNTVRDLYPSISPHRIHRLKVSDLHTIYVEECGNPNGIPVIFLHGGPGGGCQEDHRRFFHPAKYRIILFDQRGCGRSTPFAELRENSTWDLVADIERIRELCGIQQWMVFGGSWGSTLALAYGSRHFDRVLAFVLRGIFMCRPQEIRWFYQSGADQIFPDEFAVFRNFIPASEQHDLLTAYYRRLTGEDQILQLQAAQIWSRWEMATSFLFPKPSAVEEISDPQRALPFARIESHYFVNNAFFKSDSELLDSVTNFKHIPAVLVQGRYDVVCPATSAWELHQRWPGSILQIIPTAGHAASEPGIRSALVTATDQWADHRSFSPKASI